MKPWTITWDDLVWSADDLSSSEAASLEMLLGGGWIALDATAGPVALLNHIAVHVAEVRGTDYEVVVAELRALPISVVLASLKVGSASGADAAAVVELDLDGDGTEDDQQ
jgi:hypothetical protein